MDMNVSVSEGAGSVGIDITASGATFVEVFLESGSATGHTYNLYCCTICVYTHVRSSSSCIVSCVCVCMSSVKVETCTYICTLRSSIPSPFPHAWCLTYVSLQLEWRDVRTYQQHIHTRNLHENYFVNTYLNDSLVLLLF